MPRGAVSGATAALIHAVAEHGVQISAYQIERWRASGDLPRPVRRGLGRGRGTAGEPPDDATVYKAVVLAGASRQGSRRFGSHPIERVATGQSVPEPAVRKAVNAVLDQVAGMVAAQTLGEAGWEARNKVVAQAAREVPGTTWQDLIDAADRAPERPVPPRAQRRRVAAGIIHALGAGDEALSDDLIEMTRLAAGLSEEEVQELGNVQLDAELRGEDPWGQVANEMSLDSLRRVADTASLPELERAIKVVGEVAGLHTLLVMIGLLDLVGSRPDLGERLNRFNVAMIHQLQADPVWPRASMYRLSASPRSRVRELVFFALGLLAIGQLDQIEAYRDRLLRLAYAPVQTTST